MDTEVEDKKETKRQKQVDLLENRHDYAGISSTEHAGDKQTDTQRDSQTDRIHDSSMHKTHTAGAMQHDTTRHSVSYLYLQILQRKGG